MKRTLIVLGLALVMVLGAAATAHAANPPGTYKLSVCMYYDANCNGRWDAEEPLVPFAVYLLGPEPYQNVPDSKFVGYQVKACGVGCVYLPAGTTWYGLASGSEPPGFPVAWFPQGIWVGEVFPLYDAGESEARVVMNGNRCMIFGLAPGPIN